MADNLFQLFCHFYHSVLTLTDNLFQYRSMILCIEKHYWFLFEYYKYILIKKVFHGGHEVDKFFVHTELYKNALFILQHAGGFLQKCPYCAVNCTMYNGNILMSCSPFDFIFAHNNIQMIIVQVIETIFVI